MSLGVWCENKKVHFHVGRRRDLQQATSAGRGTDSGWGGEGAVAAAALRSKADEQGVRFVRAFLDFLGYGGVDMKTDVEVSIIALAGRGRRRGLRRLSNCGPVISTSMRMRISVRWSGRTRPYKDMCERFSTTCMASTRNSPLSLGSAALLLGRDVLPAAKRSGVRQDSLREAV